MLDVLKADTAGEVSFSNAGFSGKINGYTEEVSRKEKNNETGLKIRIAD